MKRDHCDFPHLSTAQLSWDDNGDPYATAFEDLYYSSDDGPGESLHTFVLGSDLPTRWQSFTDSTFCIAETGFGTGLNFLLTWQAWLNAASPKPDLHYVSVERFPLSHTDLARALRWGGELTSVSDALLDQYPPAIPGCHRLVFSDARVRLDLHLGDAVDVLADLASHNRRWVDAWYLDGFAPANNPDMWHTELALHAASLSKPAATLATFTAAGAVRRAFSDAGFSMHKVPGYGRKREALRGVLQTPGADKTPSETATQAAPAKPATPASPAQFATPWDASAAPRQRPDAAIVLGAGLAGCWVANALAKRGIAVTVFDKGERAGAGSGNAQGVLYTRLSHRHSTLTDFSLLSFCLAAQRYRALFRDGALREGVDGTLCGNLQLISPGQDTDDISACLVGLEGLAQVLDAEAAAQKAGIALPAGGYWFPSSGWLDPRAVCRALLQHPNIELQENCGALSLHASAGNWELKNTQQVVLHSAACAVVATGTDTTALPQLQWLPTRRIRGQTTQLPELPTLKTLRSALCHEGYVAPSREGEHCIGASFELDAATGPPSEREHSDNLRKLAIAVPTLGDELAALDITRLEGRAGLRCASPDYLPVVGPIPDYNAFIEVYKELRNNARQAIKQTAPQLPGLYVSTAHGSRGLTSSPLAAELLAGIICHEPPPIERSLSRAVSPARFIIRGLAKNRIEDAK